MEFPQSREKEMEMVYNNDSSDLEHYIGIFIKKMLDYYDMPEETREYLTKVLNESTLNLRDLFLKNHRDDKEYKFSTYFASYVNELIKKRKDVIPKF